MDERISAVRLKVLVIRRALEESRRRLAALRARLVEAGDAASSPPGGGGRTPLFQPSLPVDDRELHFEALDTEDPRGRGER